MNTKHTPGPWTPRKRGGRWNIDSGEMGWPLITFVYDGRNADGLSLTEAERTANAHLIAAAPEMLNALKAIEPFLSVVESHGGREAVKLVDAAIAKAERKP